MKIDNIRDKKVLLRVDFNVPIKDNLILDDKKIKETLPTINLLLKNNNKIIIITHLGRPDGNIDKNLVVNPLIERLELLLLNKKIVKIHIYDKNINLKSGEIFMFENIRFFKQEEENDENFSRELSKYGEVYVNDAFGVSHREHASITGIQKYLPSFKGLLINEEVKNLKKLNNPKKHFVLIIGGKKLDKLDTINKILPKVDSILIGSYFEKYFSDEKNKITKEIKEKCKDKNINLILPDKNEIYDIQENTIKKFKDFLKDAKTIFWNGPLGYYEKDEYSKGTISIMKFISKLDADIILGGGELGSIYNSTIKGNKKIYVSTGGGATLKFIEEGNLIGIKNLD